MALRRHSLFHIRSGCKTTNSLVSNIIQSTHMMLELSHPSETDIQSLTDRFCKAICDFVVEFLLQSVLGPLLRHQCRHKAGDCKDCCKFFRNLDVCGFTLNILVKIGEQAMARKLIERKSALGWGNDYFPSAIYLAAINGDLSTLQLLLDREDASSIRFGCWSPLHAAVEIDRVDFVKLLLEHKVDINEKDMCWMTALHCAVKLKQCEMIEMLLEGGIDLSLRDSYGRTALHIATSVGNCVTIKALLERDANPNVGDYRNVTALENAVLHRLTPVVALLLEYGADPNHAGLHGTALQIAARAPSESTLRILLDHGADLSVVDTAGYTPLHRVAYSGSLKAVRLLLDRRGFDTSAEDRCGRNAMQNAASRGHLEVTKLLASVTKHVDVFSKGCVQWLQNLGMTNREEMIHFFVREPYCPEVRIGEMCSLILPYAACGGHVSLVKWLLDHGADVNEQDDKNETALLAATKGGQIEVMKLLLARGADVNAGVGDKTALGAAVLKTNETAIRCLLQHGVDVDSGDSWAIRQALRNYDEYSSYMSSSDQDWTEVQAKIECVRSKNKAILMLLLQHGAKVPTSNEERRRGLHEILKHRGFDCSGIADYLLDGGESGSDDMSVDDRTDDGFTRDIMKDDGSSNDDMSELGSGELDSGEEDDSEHIMSMDDVSEDAMSGDDTSEGPNMESEIAQDKE